MKKYKVTIYFDGYPKGIVYSTCERVRILYRRGHKEVALL